MTKSPAIVILSDAAKPMARRIAEALGGEVHGLARRVTEGVDVGFDDTGAHLSELFLQGRPVIGLMASGALIRLLAPHLRTR
jgi:cobalt-precorrin 5A hydrolase/precorrin-3B C17-methyltransferase